ncbi:MAG TPA: DUF4388 domain-containing protein [Planctomycetota bacterium]
MRYLKGHVDLVGLGQLLQDLSTHKAEGFLGLARGKDRQTVHVGPGGIRLLSSSLARVKRIARIARRALGARPMTADQLRGLLKKEKLLGWSLGQLALSEAPLRREDVEDALRRQVEEEVLDLFMWSQATFEFKEGKLTSAKAKEPLAHLELRANVTSLLLEAARREDETRQIKQALGDERGTLRKVRREFHADVLGEDVVRADAILPLINGRRTLKAVLRASIYPIFSTLRAVHTLRTAGYVEVVLPSDTLSLIVS